MHLEQLRDKIAQIEGHLSGKASFEEINSLVQKEFRNLDFLQAMDLIAGIHNPTTYDSVLCSVIALLGRDQPEALLSWLSSKMTDGNLTTTILSQCGQSFGNSGLAAHPDRRIIALGSSQLTRCYFEQLSSRGVLDITKPDSLVGLEPKWWMAAAEGLVSGFIDKADSDGGKLDVAMALIGQLDSEREKNLLGGRLCFQVAQADPAKALEMLSPLPDGKYRDGVIVGIARGWAGTDSLKCSEWVQTIPNARDKDIAIYGLISTVHSDSPEEAKQWLQTIQDAEIKKLANRLFEHE